jgi:hypothetical protein
MTKVFRVEFNRVAAFTTTICAPLTKIITVLTEAGEKPAFSGYFRLGESRIDPF